MSYLGVDVGSSYLKIWHKDESGSFLSSKCIHHRGSPRDALTKELLHMSIRPERLCYSGHVQGKGLERWRTDGLLAEIRFLKNIYSRNTILVLGAEKIELVHFNAQGRILSYQTNPACAAGTGSFLDEQMDRLGIKLADLKYIKIDENAPLVATRCAVFAKTDLIHLQQDGHSPHALYNGLCKGLVMSGLKSIFGGSIPDGSGILLTGGLLENPHIRHYLSAVLPRAIIAEAPVFSRAMGLCESAGLGDYSLDGFLDCLKASHKDSLDDDGQGALVLVKSSFPSHEMKRSLDEEGNEIWHDIQQGETFNAYLGVDVGSTSTKAVLVDELTNSIRLDIYTKTSGNPIDATRKIFNSILRLQEANNFGLKIQGCCTTGSGRKLIGNIIGADLIINEISAHAKGAKSVDEHVETIFEIGGQDSKFIRLDKGRIVDVNMNYVCAAGTGSFIEEQANTLGMTLDEISEAVYGLAPLHNSDRCTVFMNQEVTRQLASGYPKGSIMAGVLYAVFKNYLNRVVGSHPYRSERIVFQGATARNKGLVAALEQITGAEVMVSPFCHVMGAYGAALLVKERSLSASSFKGFALPEVVMGEASCRKCENMCRITTVKMEDQKVSWGYLCGREQSSLKKREENPAMRLRYDLLQCYSRDYEGRDRVVRVPALGLYDEFIPMFTEMGNELGIPIQVCYPGKEEILKELSLLGSGDFCYPIKVAIACTNVLLRTFPDDQVLLPFLVQEDKDPAILPRSLYCPFITALPSFYLNGPDAHRVFTPIIDLSKKVSLQARQMRDFIERAGFKDIPFSRVRKALKKGIKRLSDYRNAFEAHGKSMIAELPPDKPVIVLFGRPYNLYHKILNLGLPELIESLGYRVIPMDIVPDGVSNEDVMEQFPDLYWNLGQKILRKALTLKDSHTMFPLMLSNFSCGPDSFILTYFEEVSQSKPYLILELDEHGSATGYQTRIEAFCDMIEQYRAGDAKPAKQVPNRIGHQLTDLSGKTRIWLPQIHPYIPQLWAAALNRYGYDAIATGEETSAECTLGRSYCRGSECLPAAVTIGKFLSCVSNNEPGEGKTDVLFMPRAEGPCRFGQYATLQSRILEQGDHAGTRIFAPTSEDGYSFLTPAMERYVWRAICLGDLLFKLRCRTMPYHPDPQHAAKLFEQALEEICHQLLMGHEWKETVRSLINELQSSLDPSQPRKPLVGIVGEIFVRMNTFSNQHIIEAIEAEGGEAWLSPMSEWLYYVWEAVSRKSTLAKSVTTSVKMRVMHMIEQKIHTHFSPLLDDRREPPLGQVIDQGLKFIPFELEGEAILTIGRAKLFAEQGAALVVNCSPFGCMPGRITSYLFQKHPEYFEVPVVNLFFDGIGDVASQVGIYLRSITQDAHPHHKEFIQLIKDRRDGRSPQAHTGIPSREDLIHSNDMDLM